MKTSLELAREYYGDSKDGHVMVRRAIKKVIEDDPEAAKHFVPEETRYGLGDARTRDIYHISEEGLVLVKQRMGPTSKSKRGSKIVYIFEDVSGGVLKIGVTHQVERRRKTIQTASGRFLNVVDSRKFQSGGQALTVERRIHNLLDGSGITGEWFTRTEENIKIAKETLWNS